MICRTSYTIFNYNFLTSSRGEKNPFTQDSNEKLDASNKSYRNTLEWKVSLSLLPRLTLQLKSGMHLIILDFSDCCYSTTT